LEIVAGAEDDILDPSSVGLVGQGNPLGGPPPALGFANSTGWVLGPTRAPGMRAAGGRWTAARTARLAPSAATASRRTTTTAAAGSPVSTSSEGVTAANAKAAITAIFRIGPTAKIAATAREVATTRPARLTTRSRG
jgi:hypothetical protein